MAQVPWIFVSYRRASGGHNLATRIAAELEKKCGTGSIFMDTHCVEAGAHWPDTIARHLSECVATVVIIDDNWSTERLHEPNDWVCLEISESLKSSKYVLPLFVDGGIMPERHRLPGAIGAISERQGVFIDTRSPKVLSSSVSVVSDELLQNCPSLVALVREPQEWWTRIEMNSWKLVCDGKTVVTLEARETAKKSTIASGAHVIQAAWVEQQQVVYGGHEPREGDYSHGSTEPISTVLTPGEYSFTLENDRTRWSDRFGRAVEVFSGVHPRFYHRRRRLKRLSGSAFLGSARLHGNPL